MPPIAFAQLPVLFWLAAVPGRAAALPVDRPALPVPIQRIADRVTLSCDRARCRARPPGPADRDARPFEGTLGRPCTWRQRETPSGPRRVRVCF